MSNDSNRILIVLGPVIAVAFIALAIVSETGSPLFVFAVMSAVGFMILPPVIQVIMLATERFAERDWLACAIGLGVTALLVSLPTALGVFGQG